MNDFDESPTLHEVLVALGMICAGDRAGVDVGVLRGVGMTPEQKQQRIEQIEARYNQWESTGELPLWADIDFLLSLVKSQEAEHGYWPTLLDRGDGVRDHFCIGRLIKPGEIYWEFWNRGRWTSAGELFVGREAAQKQLDTIRASDATSMRSACVEKVKALRDEWNTEAQDPRADLKNLIGVRARAKVDAANEAIIELESLSIEQPKEQG